MSEVLIAVDLTILGVFIRSIVTLVALSLIVIFQPELRRFLGYLGQVDFFKRLFDNGKKKDDNKSIDVIKEIIEEEHIERAYKESEIEEILQELNLNIINKFDGYLNNNVQANSERIVYIVKKK